MFGWNKRRNQLLQEFETHLEIETRENIEAGMSPEEGRLAAKKKFGNVLLAAEESREIWGGLWLERLLWDLRYAVRSLRAAPVYSVTLACTLVLGLGCATTMLAIIDSVLLRPVDFPNSRQLVQIDAEGAPGQAAELHPLSYGAIDALRRSAHSFSAVSGYNTMIQPVGASDGARVAGLVEVTPEFFPMLGIHARSGRLIGPGDARAPVAVVNEEFWRERLRADPKAIGSPIKIKGQLRTVVGVLPAGFRFPAGIGGAMVYLPVSPLNASGEDDFGPESAFTVARLKPGISAQAALADAQSVFLHAGRKSAEQDRHLVMRSYQATVLSDVQRPLWTLLAGVIVLLLIACANAANLQIGRAASRMPEMTIRSALGASFGRLLQQLIAESIVVAFLSAAFGGLLSWVAIEVVRRTFGQAFPRFNEVSIHPVVLGALGTLAVLVGVITSIAPALNIRRQTTSPVNVRNITRRWRLPGLLVALQVALTCVLLVVSGLFVRTLQSLAKVKLGFDPNNVTTLVLMPENQDQDPKLSRQIETRLLHRFETLSGVQSVTMQTAIPFSSYNMTLHGATDISGRAFHEGDAAFYSFVSTNFVRTSGIRLLTGRGFLPGDETGSALVVLVNQAFVKSFLDGREPIGASVKFHPDPGDTDADPLFTQPMKIVGVVEDELQGADLTAPYQAMVYLDYLQLPPDSFMSGVFSVAAQYAVRSPLAPAVLASELRSVVNQDAPTMVEMSLQSMKDSVAESLAERRLALRLVAGGGLVALLLSAVGIYGVLAYSVALLRREIGIRMALGSSRLGAARLVARQAGAMLLLGLIPGLPGAWAAGYAIRSFLYGVKPLDASTVFVAGSVVILASAAAALVPAWRAAQVDPAETLRAE
jgi:predicted permease